jgi:hypothetical protein
MEISQPLGHQGGVSAFGEDDGLQADLAWHAVELDGLDNAVGRRRAAEHAEEVLVAVGVRTGIAPGAAMAGVEVVDGKVSPRGSSHCTSSSGQAQIEHHQIRRGISRHSDRLGTRSDRQHRELALPLHPAPRRAHMLP